MWSIYFVEALTALAAWTVAGYAIWKCGPGLRKLAVRCPSTSRRAVVLAEQRETEFACLQVIDVKACSLVPSQALSCGKGCVARL
ncbi:MAG: hypothetical protein LAN62_17885 [Acidobacteriia bacterium]|nr:hypothetical protein [Terriglobia bacterium]